MSTTSEDIMSSTLSRWWSGKESLFPWIPKPVKLLILLLFLANAKSWPLVWHVRVWYPAIKAHYRARRLGLKRYYRTLQIGLPETDPTSASASSGPIIDDKIERSLEMGRKHKFEHPLGVKSVRKYVAGFDDCDYNYHLSNSAYSRNLDYSRMAGCIELFSPLFAPGGWMALGAAHYHYIKEIPMFSEYEIQISIGGFEDKWIYLVGEFVTYPKATKSKKHGAKGGDTVEPQTPATTLVSEASGTAPTAPTDDAADRAPTELEEKIVRRVRDTPREDGGVLNCFSVSVYCFKMGRLTIPPRVALSFSGYGDPSNWIRAEKLLLTTPDRGRKWLQSGWKDEPVPVGSEWDNADGTDGVFEKGRREGERLKRGLDGLREVAASVSKV